ncbi:hypothetical protein P9G84_10290 [Brevibacillus centrosporus]|uniref:hypothetical protein n=1 Tax=Brevibacillus centrosporus TaxID=54910 RepID=UPI0011417A72|nr:hypothetical protein [Brevibacillus centrosporus]MEC2129357.1 hypothetical protein [Brevibacillus centrosporus]GED33525.1 hypothetical protein BCE02nite_46660 [Brevibacillus centrosporus]
MVQILSLFAVFVFLTGNFSSESRLNEVTGGHHDEAGALEEPNASGLTEERKAAIIKEYGLPKQKPSNVSSIFSYDFGPSFTERQILFNVKMITSKTEVEVTKMLGVPYSSETGKWTSPSTERTMPIVRNLYESPVGAMSVMFIDGIAARIEIKPTEAFSFPNGAIQAMRAVGLTVLDDAELESGGPHFLDFIGIDGVYAVRVVSDLEVDPDSIAYLEIIAEERFK